MPLPSPPPSGSISAQFLRGHLSFLHTHADGMKGVDSRCLANLVWALAKLDLSDDEHGGLTTDLALTVAPFIIRSVGSSSPQGLANMLWSYAKLPVAPPDVVVALMNQITRELLQAAHNEHHKPFDAQVGGDQGAVTSATSACLPCLAVVARGWWHACVCRCFGCGHTVTVNVV
jgi:hypothetical protein